MKAWKWVVIWSLGLGLTPGLMAQAAGDKATEKASAKQDFSQEAVVLELIETSIRFESDGTSTRDQKIRVRVQTDAGAQALGLLTFQYLKDYEQMDIVSMVVHKPDGTTVATGPEAVQDMAAEISREAPFFTDAREKHVPVKSLAAGDVMEYEIRYTAMKPLVPNQFWYAGDFTEGNVVLSERLRIDVPKTRAVIVKSEKVKPSITEEGERTVYTWTTAHPHKMEEKPPVLAGHLPVPDVQVTSFKSWNEMADWTNGMYRDRLVVPPELSAKAAELTKNANNDEEKLKALYNYVALRYRYIGLALGPARWQPHAAADVYSNGYGDCKDKHTLLAALLKSVGIDAYPALANSARLVDADVPSPAQFDHVMTYVSTAQGPVWLDTTMEVAPYRYIVFVMRGKTVVVIRPDRASVEKLPSENFETSEYFYAEGRIDEQGTVTAKIDRVMHGDSDIVLRSLYRRAGPGKSKELAQKVSYATGFQGSVDEVTTSAVEDTTVPFEIKYGYTRKDSPEWENRRITAFLPPLGLPQLSQEPEKANNPIILGEPMEYAYESKLALPPGYVMVVPQNRDLKRDFAEYHATYDFKDNVLYARRTLRVKTTEVKPAQFESYKSFVKAMSDDTDQYIFLSGGVFKSKSTVQGPESLVVEGVTDSDKVTPEEARSLAEQGRSAIIAQNFRSAESLLNRVVATDPTIKDVWGMLGLAQLANGKVELGIASLKKQIALDPQNVNTYSMLATAYLSSNRLGESIPIWRKVLELDPKNHNAFLMLSSAEAQLRQYREEATDLEKSLEAYPDDPAMLMALGDAYQNSGRTEEGLDMLRKAAANDSSGMAQNNLAYALAEANQDLDGALKWALQAVQTEEAQGQDADLINLTNQDFQHPLKLAQVWDTLGWVYFRKGDLVNAEKYLRAAWAMSQSATMGYHLGQVYEREKKTHAASRTYAMALAANGDAAQKAEIQGRLEKLVAARAKINAMTLQGLTDLNGERTVKAPWTAKAKYSSDFFILIGSDSKVEKVELSNTPGTEALQETIKKLGARQPFPEMSGTKVVRKGVVFCSGGPTCDVALVPTTSAMN